MAKETITRLKDDLDGSEAKATIQFSWGGTAYEIDLNAKNSRAFEEAVAPYLAVSRRISSKRNSKGPAAKPARATVKHDLAAVRAWAAGNGMAVATRGRIATTVIEAYHAAQNTVSAVARIEPATRPARKSPVKRSPARQSTAKKSTPRKATTRQSTPKPTRRKAAARKATAALPAAARASA